MGFGTNAFDECRLESERCIFHEWTSRNYDLRDWLTADHEQENDFFDELESTLDVAQDRSNDIESLINSIVALQAEEEDEEPVHQGSIKGLRNFCKVHRIAELPALGCTSRGLLEAQWFHTTSNRLALRFREDGEFVDYYLAVVGRSGGINDSSGQVEVATLSKLLNDIGDPTKQG